MQEVNNTEEYVKEEDFEETKKGDWKTKIQDFLESKYFAAVSLILIAIIAFCLGRVSGLQEKRVPVRVLGNSGQVGEVKGASVNLEKAQPSQSPSLEASANQRNATAGTIVASKSGTKYHYSWCAGAKQISAKNLITFNSIEEARSAGYTPASNCKGLK